MSDQKPNHVRQTIHQSPLRRANENFNDCYVDEFGEEDNRSTFDQRTPPQYRFQTLTDSLRLRHRFMPESPPNQTFFQPPKGSGSHFTHQNTFNGNCDLPYTSRDPRLQSSIYHTQMNRENSGNIESMNSPVLEDSNSSEQEHTGWNTLGSKKSPQAGPSSSLVKSKDPRMQNSFYNAQLNRENSGKTEPLNLAAISPVEYSLSNSYDDSNNSAGEHSVRSDSTRERSPQAGSSSSRDDLVSSPMSTTEDEEENPYIRLAKRTVRGKICVEVPKPRPPVYPLEDAYSEYLKCTPIPPRTETQTDPFNSSDPLENRDNSPTRWGRVRDLKDDEERKTFAREQFGNQESSNPARNMTYHGHRRSVLADDLGVRFRPVGDYYSSNYVHVVDGVLEYIDPSSMKHLDSGRKRKREYNTRSTLSNPTVTIPFQEFEAKLVQKVRELKFPELLRTCSDEVESRYNMNCTRSNPCPPCSRRRLRNWESYLKHFKAGMVSSKNFLGFYFGQSRHGQRAAMEVRIPSDLLKTGIEIEEIFARFNQFFGSNQEQRCRDCQTSHIF